MKLFYILFVFLLLSFGVHALSGVVYDFSLNRVPYAIISFYLNGTLYSRVVADGNATFSVNVPPGRYTIIAYKPGTMMYSNESLIIKNYNQSYDIILAPHIQYPSLPGNVSLPGLGYLNNTTVLSVSDNKLNVGYIVVAVLILISLVGIIFASRKKYVPKDKDKELVVQLIREAGGILPQKRIVENTGWSEAKVSLVLKSLKEDGIIRKRKRGREKLVYLLDVHGKRKGAANNHVEMID